MDSPVLFNELTKGLGKVGVITLNRPDKLNAINLQMVQLLHEKLVLWANDARIKAVIIEASPGRAFCAGGDLRLTYETNMHSPGKMWQFFQAEYELNKLIYHYPKPYIAFLNGLTMGGGVGISIHGSHRIGTENLIFAMPETAIGFFPDIGGTYFLPRLPQHVGYYLALTGARLTAEQCLNLNIITHRIPLGHWETIRDTIVATPFAVDEGKAVINDILGYYQLPHTKTALSEDYTSIDECFSMPRVEEIIACLNAKNTEFSQETCNALQSKSPTSLKVTLKALQVGKNLSFDECMQQELLLARHFLEGYDFMEGIRALIVDKDQKPKWQPSSLNLVNEKTVDSYFQQLIE